MFRGPLIYTVLKKPVIICANFLRLSLEDLIAEQVGRDLLPVSGELEGRREHSLEVLVAPIVETFGARKIVECSYF